MKWFESEGDFYRQQMTLDQENLDQAARPLAGPAGHAVYKIFFAAHYTMIPTGSKGDLVS